MQNELKTEPQSDTSKFSLVDYAQKLKSYNPMQYFTEGSLIDGMDSNNSWRVARISQIKNDILTLSYDGWSSKWDEVTSKSYKHIFL